MHMATIPNRDCKWLLVSTVLFLAVLLPHAAHGARHDTDKINRQLTSMQQMRLTQPFDSTVQQARAILHQAQAANYIEGMAWAELHIGTAFMEQERLDSALPHAHRSLVLFEQPPRPIGGLVQSLCLLADILLSSDAVDSALLYNYKAIDLVLGGAHDTLLLARPYHGLGQDYIRMGNAERALPYLTRAIALHRASGNRAEQANSMNSLGFLLAQQNDLLGAMEQHYKALGLYSELSHIEGMLNQHNSIARILFMLNDHPHAIEHLQKALTLKQQSHHSTNIALLMMNIGNVYLSANSLDSALRYARHAHRLATAHNMLDLQGHTALLLGEVLNLKALHDTAATYLDIGLRIFERIGNEEGIAHALTLQAVGLSQQRQFPEAERLLDEAERMAKTIKMPHPNLEEQMLRARYELYFARNDHRKALEVHLALTSQRDSISRMANRIYAQHMEQHGHLQPQQLMEPTRPHRPLILWLSAVAMAATFSIIATARANRQHSKLQALQARIDSFETQKLDLIVQANELREQKELVMHQRDKILNMLSDLGDSIAYAQKIQQAVLPQTKHLENLFREHFVFYRPKEQVGGDFYWAGLTNNHHVVFVVGDSTGHGVPGAVMSMLGISLIIEIVARNICDTPADALNTLRDNIIYTLRQHDRDIDNTDGMDLAMCVYRPEEQMLYYSGANIPMYIATNHPLEPSERIRRCSAGLYEIKSDHMSICHSEHMEPFSDFSLKLQPTDTIYLSTDGFPDQFGGKKNRKYGHPAFRALLNRIKQMPFRDQQHAIESALEEWQLDRTQTDDILVMGIKPRLPA